MAQGELQGFPLCSTQGSVNFSPEHSLPESINFTSHYTRSQAQAEQAGHSHQLPLVTAAGAALLTCKPWQLGDITGLRNELLPLPNRAGPWIQALNGHTRGVELAMGDLRAIIAACAGTHTLTQTEIVQILFRNCTDPGYSCCYSSY